ncbi:DUF6527 family protein [Shewanella baltica]|uniref:DUF6527 family protein n=1 Tax=Shewanella baltica TaxID=62322 RepID=UPI00216950D0|nr:DUF6527 family protein [Shewanella baltica]MCS6115937.1 hypothetical protein [Shewanella baltica]UVW62359.1 hypothetical protein HHE93_01700 [Shewanella baltica]
MILTFIKKFEVFFKRIFTKTYKVELVEDEPDNVDERIIYIVGDKDFYAIAIMLCPCGCKSKINLNLIHSDKPTWTIKFDNKMPTIKPSIWRTVGCKSHFFLRSGKVVWAKNR